MYLLDQFFKISQIDEIIYAELSKIKSDFIKEFIKIITLIMFYELYKNINSYLLYIKNTQDGPPKCIQY